MNLALAFKARTSRTARPELEQALLRVTLALIVTSYVLWSVSRRLPSSADDRLVVECLIGWLVLAIGIFFAVWVWPAANRLRRMLGMLADAGAITLGLFFLGGAGTVLVGASLFIIFGNGFRYGRADLHICQIFCLAGFALATSRAEWWNSQSQYVVWGWMYALIVLPFYVGMLADRMKAERLRVEAALKNCLSREARGS